MSKTDNKSGIIYVLINEAMSGYVKIGKTNDLEKRIRDLDKTNVPLPFKCYYACTVEDMNSAEKYVHDVFLNFRVRPRREFFQVDPARVVSALQLAKVKDVNVKPKVRCNA